MAVRSAFTRAASRGPAGTRIWPSSNRAERLSPCRIGLGMPQIGMVSPIRAKRGAEAPVEMPANPVRAITEEGKRLVLRRPERKAHRYAPVAAGYAERKPLGPAGNAAGSPPPADRRAEHGSMFLIWTTRRTSLIVSGPPGRAGVSGQRGKGFDRPTPVWQMAAVLSIAMIEGGVMPKEEWGVKTRLPHHRQAIL